MIRFLVFFFLVCVLPDPAGLFLTVVYFLWLFWDMWIAELMCAP